MDKEYEEALVRNFFNKKIQDRFIYELGSLKKRVNALSRLCYKYPEIFVQEHLVEIPPPNSDYMEIYRLLKSQGAKDDCYAISFNKNIDGQYLALKNALTEAVGFGMPSIISCFPARLLYFESEQETGPPARFIIKKDCYIAGEGFGKKANPLSK